MTIVPFYFKQAHRYLPHIAFVGLGIGTANYIMNADLNWVQWVLQSLSTSFLIGYTLVIIGLNKTWFTSYFKTKARLYFSIVLVFLLAGIVATEAEHMIRSLVFHSQPFEPFSAGNLYLFNGIISLVLGYSFFQSDFPKKKKPMIVEHQEDVQPQKNKTDEFLAADKAISSIPVKQGENILLIPIQEIVYFEAFDNYSFVHNVLGEKKLCDYSLIFLEKRLHQNFSRVHRKYIVNENQIKQIKPHLNGRYRIVFKNELDPITSSKSYATSIRKLIKIT